MLQNDIDGHKLMYHPEEVSAWVRGELNHPLMVEIGLTNKCNHRCTYCIAKYITHGKDKINTDVLIAGFNNMKRIGVKSVYFAGEGEPTLHEDFIEIIQAACTTGLDVYLSTNGSAYDEKKIKGTLQYLKWIRFSLDTSDKKTYKFIHGVSIDKSVENIKDTIYYKNHLGLKVDIGIQVVYVPELKNNVLYTVQDARIWGADNFQVKPLHNPEGEQVNLIDEQLLLNLSKFSTDKFAVIVRTQSAMRLIKPRNYSYCHGWDFYTYLDCRGNILPCILFWNKPDYFYGNINEESFYEIWNNSRRKQVNEKIAAQKFKGCGSYKCRFDVFNRYLERIIHPEKNDSGI